VFNVCSSFPKQETVKNGNHIKIPATCKPQLKALIQSCFSLETIVEFISNYPRMLTPCMDVPKPNLDDQVNLIDGETDQLEMFEQQIMEHRDRSHTPAIAVDFLRTSVSSSALQNHSNHHVIQRQDPSSFEYLDMKLPRKPNGICLHDFHPDLTATLPNGNYNPVEPLLQNGPRQEISKSNLSLMKYVPMCGGFGKNSKRSSSPDDCTSEV
jgi:translation initiation factor 2 beta subunit (eIF-2beta)/eIF-5